MASIGAAGVDFREGIAAADAGVEVAALGEGSAEGFSRLGGTPL